jgi:phosphoglucomutase
LQSKFVTEQLPAMLGDIEQLNSRIERAVTDGLLMASSAKNICTLLAGANSDLYVRSVDELVGNAEWRELNDRFYQTLAFGTGDEARLWSAT